MSDERKFSNYALLYMGSEIVDDGYEAPANANEVKNFDDNLMDVDLTNFEEKKFLPPPHIEPNQTELTVTTNDVPDKSKLNDSSAFETSEFSCIAPKRKKLHLVDDSLQQVFVVGCDSSSVMEIQQIEVVDVPEKNVNNVLDVPHANAGDNRLDLEVTPEKANDDQKENGQESAASSFKSKLAEAKNNESVEMKNNSGTVEARVEENNENVEIADKNKIVLSNQYVLNQYSDVDESYDLQTSMSEAGMSSRRFSITSGSFDVSTGRETPRFFVPLVKVLDLPQDISKESYFDSDEFEEVGAINNPAIQVQPRVDFRCDTVEQKVSSDSEVKTKIQEKFKMPKAQSKSNNFIRNFGKFDFHDKFNFIQLQNSSFMNLSDLSNSLEEENSDIVELGENQELIVNGVNVAEYFKWETLEEKLPQKEKNTFDAFCSGALKEKSPFLQLDWDAIADELLKIEPPTDAPKVVCAPSQCAVEALKLTDDENSCEEYCVESIEDIEKSFQNPSSKIVASTPCASRLKRASSFSQKLEIQEQKKLCSQAKLHSSVSYESMPFTKSYHAIQESSIPQKHFEQEAGKSSEVKATLSNENLPQLMDESLSIIDGVNLREDNPQKHFDKNLAVKRSQDEVTPNIAVKLQMNVDAPEEDEDLRGRTSLKNCEGPDFGLRQTLFVDLNSEMNVVPAAEETDASPKNSSQKTSAEIRTGKSDQDNMTPAITSIQPQLVNVNFEMDVDPPPKEIDNPPKNSQDKASEIRTERFSQEMTPSIASRLSQFKDLNSQMDMIQLAEKGESSQEKSSQKKSEDIAEKFVEADFALRLSKFASLNSQMDMDSPVKKASENLEKFENMFEDLVLENPTLFETRRLTIIKQIEKIYLELLKSIKEEKPLLLKIQTIKSWEDCKMSNDVLSQNERCLTTKTLSFHNKTTSVSFTCLIVVMCEVYKLLSRNTMCTRRELFYQDVELFQTQVRVDEAVRKLCLLLDVQEFELGVLSSSKGLMAGDFKINFGEESMSCNTSCNVPANPSAISSFETKAEFVLVVEKDTVFQRLINDPYYKAIAHKIVLVTAKGYPDVNTRLLLKKISTLTSLPIYLIVDADPHGIEIMFTYKYGSIMRVHSAEYLAVSNIQWIGIHPTEVETLDVNVINLTEADLKKVDELLTRPYINPQIKRELNCLKQTRQKAEIEGIYHFSLENFINDYIPRKIRMIEPPFPGRNID